MYMRKLYELSESYGIACVASLPEDMDVTMSDSSVVIPSNSPSTTTPTAVYAVTPEHSPRASPAASPARTKPQNVVDKQDICMEVPQDIKEDLGKDLEEDEDFDMRIPSGCLLGVNAVISQFAACTGDFFGDKNAGDKNSVKCGKRKMPRTAKELVPAIPATITFGSAEVETCNESLSLVTTPATPTSELKLDDGLTFDDSLYELVSNVDKQSHRSLSYKLSDREGSSLIDNVWVVSSFFEDQQPVVEECDEVSMDSTIMTRRSHRL